MTTNTNAAREAVERKSFEDWYTAGEPNNGFARCHGSDEYLLAPVRHAWQAWQARAALTTAAGAVKESLTAAHALPPGIARDDTVHGEMYYTANQVRAMLAHAAPAAAAATPTAASIAWTALRDLTDPLGEAGVKIMGHVRIYAQRQYEAGKEEADRAARAPADSVTAPAGWVVVTDDMVLAALRAQYPAAYGQYLRHPANGPKTSLRTESEIDTAQRMIVAALSVAPTPPAQAADSVLEDAARYRWLAAHCRSTSEHWGGRWSIVVEGPAPKSHNSEDDFDAAIDAARKQGANHD